ncbi:hypothetical protein EUX98_g8407 [Antrodiella citrinella]|uniref:Actin interacting protein 3 C-terminal domain-containing protein n=1 Tax=Antrodiella citrinella TaxID=2447956 RepID=A0A4S4M7M1_9APHY|nr:hypothetical protein EUX98_g8407 [Antrodiella citrinella]
MGYYRTLLTFLVVLSAGLGVSAASARRSSSTNCEPFYSTFSPSDVSPPSLFSRPPFVPVSIPRSYAVDDNGLSLFMDKPKSHVTTKHGVNDVVAEGATVNSTFAFTHGIVTMVVKAPEVAGAVTAAILIAAGNDNHDEVDEKIPLFGVFGGIEKYPNKSSISKAHNYTIDWNAERIIWSVDGSQPAVESAVTRLLVAIKQLLESLTLWSQQKVAETHVSDVYVRLGNDFNAAVAAFASFNIDMTELLSVPDDLRAILELCLAEDATAENLEIFLPDVRKIITRLLQGLRGKQSLYRRLVSEHKHTTSSVSNPERPESRTSSRHESTSSSGGRRPSKSVGDSDSLARRSASSTKSRKESVSGSSRPPTNGSEQFVGGFAMQAEDPVISRSSTPGRRAANGVPSRTGSTPVQIPPDLPPVPPSSTPQQDKEPLPRPTSVYAPVPSHVPRFSLSDKPILSTSTPPPPAVVIDEAMSPQIGNEETPTSRIPPSPIEPDATPAVQNSLAALKKSDVLERRASKRFSTYNISKMTGGSIRERMTNGNHGSRMSIAASNALTPGDLATLDEEDERSPSPNKRTRRGGRNPSPITEDDEEPPPVPPLPSRDVSPSKSLRQDTSISVAVTPPTPFLSATMETKPTSLTVFLQVGREVKKVTIEPGLTFSSLRVLFVDRFSYSPGKDNFPAIYIRDPSSGVQYELEDIEEIKDRCLLSLNIEPLDQIKQHIDSQISTLSQDIKDLRATVASSRRASMSIPPMILGQPLAESTPAPNRPSDRSFRQAARQLSRLIPEKDEDGPTPTRSEPIISQMTGSSIQPQMTGMSVMTESSARIVGDLKNQFDEVQNLRRDLGIMRQLYTEFMKQTKESLGTLRAKTQNVRQLATNKVGGARAYIDDGKTKLDSRSQNALTKMEELQDTVESIKDDVLKRNISPRPQVLKNIKADVDSVSAELQSLKDHIQTIKPMWKKTWEEELQNIVEEQQFLSHQEEFLTDLLEDQKAVLEVYGHVEKVISLRGTGSARALRTGRGFKPPPVEDSSAGIGNVMLEIRTATVDAERRMKAIAANEKQREKELAARSDEFQAELTGFVDGKKLKMTGGAEEVERIRQKRNESTLKAMFTGGTLTPSSSATSVDGDLPPLPVSP